MAPSLDPSFDRLRFRECGAALSAIPSAASAGEDQLFKSLNDLRLAVESLCFDYDTLKSLEGLENAERFAGRVTGILDEAISSLRDYAIEFVAPGGMQRGQRGDVPLDAYQLIGAWISDFERRKAGLLEPEDDECDEI